MQTKLSYSFEDLTNGKIHEIKAQSQWEAEKNLAKILNLTPEIFAENLVLRAIEND